MEKPKLTTKQKIFCDYYLSNSFIGVNAYADAFDRNLDTDYNNIKSSASQLLSKPQVQDYLNDKLEQSEITMKEALAKLSFLIKQHSDLSVCHQAIRTYLKLMEKIDDSISLKVEYKAKFDM